MTGDGRGGLFALSLEDAKCLVIIIGAAKAAWPETFAEEPIGDELKTRLQEWIGRHSEATP